MEAANFDSIVAEVIAKRPVLNSESDWVKKRVADLGDIAEALLGNIDRSKGQLSEGLDTVDLEQGVTEEAKREFAHWGIEPVKFATHYGGKTEEHAWKLMQLRVAKDPTPDMWEETMKIFVLARLSPKFDVLVSKVSLAVTTTFKS